MFKFLLKESVINSIVEKITKNVNTSLDSIQTDQGQKFNQVIEHLEKLRIELSSLDQRITQKELKDKMEYGQMRYQINSLQNDLREKKPKLKSTESSH
jgi:hypothetical protein